MGGKISSPGYYMTTGLGPVRATREKKSLTAVNVTSSRHYLDEGPQRARIGH